MKSNLPINSECEGWHCFRNQQTGLNVFYCRALCQFFISNWVFSIGLCHWCLGKSPAQCQEWRWSGETEKRLLGRMKNTKCDIKIYFFLLLRHDRYLILKVQLNEISHVHTCSWSPPNCRYRICFKHLRRFPPTLSLSTTFPEVTTILTSISIDYFDLLLHFM